jgi:orotidine-5'-phosphate decarboxylase
MRVVPGIRAAKVSTEDQARIATAAEAATAGANYIVVGRPILEANDPINATKNIIEILSKVKR